MVGEDANKGHDCQVNKTKPNDHNIILITAHSYIYVDGRNAHTHTHRGHRIR
jgi:hypothetical protein